MMFSNMDWNYRPANEIWTTNDVHLSVKFDYFSNKEINFLDTGNQALQERIRATGLFTS